MPRLSTSPTFNWEELFLFRFVEQVENVPGKPMNHSADFLDPPWRSQIQKTPKTPFFQEMRGERHRNGHSVGKDVHLAVTGDPNVSPLIALDIRVARKEAGGFEGGLGEIPFPTPLSDPQGGSGNFSKWPGARGSHPKSQIAKRGPTRSSGMGQAHVGSQTHHSHKSHDLLVICSKLTKCWQVREAKALDEPHI